MPNMPEHDKVHKSSCCLRQLTKHSETLRACPYKRRTGGCACSRLRQPPGRAHRRAPQPALSS